MEYSHTLPNEYINSHPHTPTDTARRNPSSFYFAELQHVCHTANSNYVLRLLRQPIFAPWRSAMTIFSLLQTLLYISTTPLSCNSSDKTYRHLSQNKASTLCYNHLPRADTTPRPHTPTALYILIAPSGMPASKPPHSLFHSASRIHSPAPAYIPNHTNPVHHAHPAHHESSYRIYSQTTYSTISIVPSRLFYPPATPRPSEKAPTPMSHNKPPSPLRVLCPSPQSALSVRPVVQDQVSPPLRD